jgi:hypothetical protein
MSYFERRITMDLHRVDPMRVLDFRAVPMGLTAGDTRVRWWNWEPILGSLDAKVENEAMRAAHGAHAMMERLEPHVKMLAEMDPYGSRFMFANPGERHPLSGDIALKFWRESVELLGNWLGLVKTHYTVPGADGTPELRTSEARLP